MKKIILTYVMILVLSGCSSPIKTQQVQVKPDKTPENIFGCIEGNCKNGSGTYLWENGSKYIGEFKNGNMDGKGTFYFGKKSISPGAEYTGDFKNDFIDGNGIWTWPNGDKYVGEVKFNKMHGKGTYYYSNGDIKRGTWLNDKYVEE